jgi:hypothetical protein
MEGCHPKALKHVIFILVFYKEHLIPVRIQKYNKAAKRRGHRRTTPKPPPAGEKEEPTMQPTQLDE